MESNRNNPNKNKQNPQGDNPKKGMGPALIIALALVLLFSWVYNVIRDSQYTAATLSDFFAAKEAGQLAEVEFQYDRILYMTKEEAAKDPSQQRACFTGYPSGGDMLALAEELIAEGYVPAQDVYLCSGCTEEVGGDGAPKIVEWLRAHGVRLAMLCDEGGGIYTDPMMGIKGNFAMIGVAEKGRANVRFTAKGKGGHEVVMYLDGKQIDDNPPQLSEGLASGEPVAEVESTNTVEE